MKKRVISLILALVMVIGILPVNVLAAEPAEQVQTPQAVTIETSLDGELTDGVFTTAEEPLDVKIRAAADGETVEHTAKLDGEVLEGTPEEDGWTTYVLSFAQSGSYTLDISAADEEQSRTIVYQAQDTQDGEQDVQEHQEDPADKSSDEPMDEVLSEDTEETSTLEEAADALFEERSGDAAEQEIDTSDDAGLGTVRVIIENTTTSGRYGDFWMAGASEWTGTRVDTYVTLKSDSNAISVIADAVKSRGEGHTIYGSVGSKTEPTDYIAAIDGLQAFSSEMSYGGWYISLNDWFINETGNSYKVSVGNLQDGDEVRAMYYVSGADLGGTTENNNKTLSALTVTGATLNPSFSSATNAYELVIGEAESASITLTPTASNKNFLACVFSREVSQEEAADKTEMDAYSWFRGTGLVHRGESVTVKPGDKLSVVVGAAGWPTQNSWSASGGVGSVDTGNPVIYTLEVVKTGTDHSADFNRFFTALEGVATVENDATYPLKVDADENALVSTNQGKAQVLSGVKITFQKTAKLSFQYKTDCVGCWSYLKVAQNGTHVNKESYSVSGNYQFSGAMSEYRTYEIEASTGDVVEVGFFKSFADDDDEEYEDCAWLKNFTVTLPNAVIFHANDGTDVTSKQDIFGTANLTKNTFTPRGLPL